MTYLQITISIILLCNLRSQILNLKSGNSPENKSVMTAKTPLPIPEYFDPKQVSAVWRVPYQERAAQAKDWAKQHGIQPAASDTNRICLMIIDAQNTFCLPEFELFVGGRSGTGAVDDNLRLCEFIYRNLNLITAIAPTMDTHTSIPIFHPIF